MRMRFKRILSLLLALVMIAALLPVTDIFAETAGLFEYNIDLVSNPAIGILRVEGWAYFGWDSGKSIEVHVYVGGPTGAAGVEGFPLVANLPRPDVNTAFTISGDHGFAADLPIAGKYGTQPVYFYAVYGDTVQQLGDPRMVYISPPDPPYGDAYWNLSQYDYCPNVPDGVYRISSAANPNFSFDMTDGSVNHGANLQLYQNLATDAQLFHLRRISQVDVQTGNGALEKRTVVSFMNIKSQHFLDKDFGSHNVHQYGDLPDNAYRQWILHNNGDGSYSLESVAEPGYFMTIEGSVIQNKANICVALPNSNGTPTLYQRFYLNAEYVHGDNRLSALTGYLKSGQNRLWASTATSYTDTYVLDIRDTSTAEGGNAQIWSDVDGVAAEGSIHLQQIFDIQEDGRGWYTIRNINSGLYLAAASGAAGRHLDEVQQWNTAGDAAKWAFVPRVRSDNTISYWIVNKATGLYLLRFGNENGKLTYLCYLDNSSVVESDWRSWGLKSCVSIADVGAITNGATGVAADRFDTTDTINLPIKIYDYNDDGMLFEYSLNTLKDNGAFTLTHASDTPNYTSWAIGQTTTGAGSFPDTNASGQTYFIGDGKFWTASPDKLNHIYAVNRDNATADIDLQYLSDYLNYSFYGEMTTGNATMGLLKPTLREVDGYILPQYNDEVVAYIADLLEKILHVREGWDGNMDSLASIQDIPLGTVLEGYDKDMAGLLIEQLNANNNTNQLPRYSTDPATRRGQIYDNLVTTYQNENALIGIWGDCKDNIISYTDAAYFLLNNLFYPGSYNMPQDKFDYLVLSKAELSNGKTAYVFDSNFSTTYNYMENVTESAVEYDFDAKTISNSSMLGKPELRALLTTIGGPYFTFLPVWEAENVQKDFYNVYTGSYENKNYNYVLQCSGVFTYTENDGLFFDFAGDDDVYLFINGQLVLDIGGAHAITTVNMNVNDYVCAARAAVAAGSTDPRDLALALEDGEDYSFDFYYMERHTSGANMRIATNIRVSDPNLDAEKKAYQNGQELNNGGLVNTKEHVEYSFVLSNPEDSIANLYHLSFADAKLGVTIDSVNGLTVSGDKTLNSQDNALTAADLKVYFTNQKGSTQEVSLDGTNEDLKNYLTQINGHGLLPGCSVEIRGIFYNIEDSDFVSGRFANTLQVTANQEANGEGDTYQASDNMVVCAASGPQYYQWSGNVLNVTAADFTEDVNTLLQKENSALLEQIAPATSLGTIAKLEICDMKGNALPSSNAAADATGISLNYSKPGTYVLYVKVTQSDNSTVIIPVQVNVVDVEDSVFVLDYGLKVDLTELLTAKDSLSIAGKETHYVFEALTGTEPSYANNHITLSDGRKEIDGAYGRYLLQGNTLEYHPDGFMEGADVVYLAVRVYEGEPSETIGAADINTEVEMYKKITVLPANVVYYEDDFPTIKYYGNSDGTTANTFTLDGEGSGAIYQSADQSGRYGYDDAYASGTTQSGTSAHTIKILDAKVAAEFSFAGTGFELISRCMMADDCVIYLDVYNDQDTLVKRIPVILEYDDIAVSNGTEGIYQVPVVKIDDLAHGTYQVQIHGVPTYQKDEDGNFIKDDNGSFVIDTENAPTLYIDGLRVYNALDMSDPNRDHYADGEDTAQFLEIRDLLLEGKASVITADSANYSITSGISTFTENRNGESYPVDCFIINSVSHYGYFVDADGERWVGLRRESNKLGNSCFTFSFAKTLGSRDYYYIHLNLADTACYLKKNEDGSVALTELGEETGFLWEISYLDSAKGIVTIRNQAEGYLSLASVDAAAKTGEIRVLQTEAVTDDQKWELGAVPTKEVFAGNAVTSVNDYLVFGPNNELYLDGVNANQALAFYFTPDDLPETTTMIQVGVHVLNDGRLFGNGGELINPGSLYQSANTEIPGWKVLDDAIATSTERYYPIDLSVCKYDAANNRYEVVLYCEDGYLSFTNLKVSGGSIRVVNSQLADLRYQNGVLQLLTSVGASQTKAWMAVSNPGDYVDFASLSRQMNATILYEPDLDTGEFVPTVPNPEDWVVLVGRSLLFKDMVKMRFYFNISATGVTTATPENSGLLVWTAEEYAALDSYTVNTAGQQIRGLTHSVNGYYADTKGIPAKNMVDTLYVRAYVILPDGSYAYSEVTEFSPVMYAKLILQKEDAAESMKDLAIALMNYGAAAQVYFNYKTDTLMNAWLTEEQRAYSWSEDMIQALPKDCSKYLYTADDRIVWRGSSVTFVGAVNQNFYFQIPEELTQNAQKIELLYWTQSDYDELSQLTVENARKVAYSLEEGRAVIEGTAAKDLGKAFYFAVHIVYEDGETFSKPWVDSAHDYARRVLSNGTTSDAMKALAKALVYYSCMAKIQLGG